MQRVLLKDITLESVQGSRQQPRLGQLDSVTTSTMTLQDRYNEWT
jgi:hypothetical protein